MDDLSFYNDFENTFLFLKHKFLFFIFKYKAPFKREPPKKK
jgi:hypothetical protein